MSRYLGMLLSVLIGVAIMRLYVRYRWAPQCTRCQRGPRNDCPHFTAR